jgi:hypothetical protein
MAFFHGILIIELVIFYCFSIDVIFFNCVKM